MEIDDYCFCCGKDNPGGLHLQIESRPGGGVCCEFTPGPGLQGYREVVHGGILSTLLDELMAHAALRAVDRHSATARIQVTFRKPALTGRKMRIEGEVVRSGGRRIITTGRIFNDENEILAEAEALFLQVET